MLKSYEAIYSHGKLQWVDPFPPEGIEDSRVLVILDVGKVASKHGMQKQKNIHALLKRTCGAMSKGRSMVEIDSAITSMRKEWDRKWDK